MASSLCLAAVLHPSSQYLPPSLPYPRLPRRRTRRRTCCAVAPATFDAVLATVLAAVLAAALVAGTRRSTRRRPYHSPRRSVPRRSPRSTRRSLRSPPRLLFAEPHSQAIVRAVVGLAVLIAPPALEQIPPPPSRSCIPGRSSSWCTILPYPHQPADQPSRARRGSPRGSRRRPRRRPRRPPVVMARPRLDFHPEPTHTNQTRPTPP